VAAKYFATSGTTCTTSAPINFDTKVYDTTGGVTTGASWKFSPSLSGKYKISEWVNSASGTNATFLYVYKNGSALEPIAYSSNVSTNLLIGASEVNLLQGDYIDLRCGTSTATSGNASQSSGNASHIEITRVGN